MDFGMETYDGLTTKDFAFPELKQSILPGQKITTPHLYIGLPKWGRTDWVGTLYPPMTKEKEFLDHYVQHFNSIELNATHFKIHSKETIKKWIDKAGDKDFKFCPKMYQGVTHRGSLLRKELALYEFFESIDAFEKHLGPVFIQMSEAFSPKRKTELFEFLKKLPPKFRCFLELRHKDWFSDPYILEELFQNLKELNIGFVITDTPGRRDIVHMKLSIPTSFIRFGCYGDNELDNYRIEQWKHQLQQWYQHGLESSYFFLHIRNEEKAIDFAKFVQEQLNQMFLSC